MDTAANERHGCQQRRLPEHNRNMTKRSLIIGSIGAMFVAGFGYVGAFILRLPGLDDGFLPVGVVGFLLLAQLVLNPFVLARRKQWRLRGDELAVVALMLMAAFSVCGRGMMQQFTQVLVMPYHWGRMTPGWREKEILSYAPEGALADASDFEQVVTGFVNGAPNLRGRDAEGLGARLTRWRRQVPWRAWGGALRTWLPMLFLVGLCSACLTLIVHRQWVHHEHLSYPVAEFLSSLVEKEPDQRFPAVFVNRLFWIGFGAVFLVRLNNGLCRWFPDVLIHVRTVFPLWPLIHKFPIVTKVNWYQGVFYLRFVPMMVAFAFFLSSEVTLTLGLSMLIWLVVALPIVSLGVPLSTHIVMGGWCGWQRTGSYIAFALLMIYTGRAYYGDTLLKAVGLRKEEENDDPGVTLAWRGLIAGFLLLVFLVWRLGVEAPLAAALVALALLAFVVVSRINVETGLLHIQARWQAAGFLLSMLGSHIIGPRAIVVCCLFCLLFSLCPMATLAPHVVNGFRLCERMKVAPARAAGLAYGVFAAGVVVALLAGLPALYNCGTPKYHRWSYSRMPVIPFNAAHKEVLRLEATDSLEAAQTLPWYRKLRRIHARDNFWWAAGFGFVMVLVFAFLRLRLPWWPLHPVLFLVWATWSMSTYAWSFLLGWSIKAGCMRFGGPGTVRRLRPLMFGVIAGEMAAAVVFAAVGIIYYTATGRPPVPYRWLY